MILSKKAKKYKNNKTQFQVIHLSESIKQTNPFEYLDKIDRKNLSKFIIKSLKGLNYFFSFIIILLSK